VVPARDPLRSQTIRASLLLGFGLTFGLWLFAGYQFTRRMVDVQRDTAAINDRYLRAQERLSKIRANVLLGSVYLRDALLDANPDAGKEYRSRLEDSYNAVDEALTEYEPLGDSAEERARLDRLKAEIENFRGMIGEILENDSRRLALHARDLLRTRVGPRRELVIRVSEEVQSLNRAEFMRRQQDLATISRDAQRLVWAQLGFALVTNVAIALVAILYAGRLESRLREQMIKDLENSRNLQRLSSQLITAQEDERRAIARELHDEIGQALTAIKMEVAVAQRSIQAAGGSADLLDDARTIVDGALQSTRDLSHLIHPALLDDLGLPAAVDWYLRGFRKRHGLAAELLEEGMAERLAPEIETAAYRVIQEAVTNVAKHANATLCRVYLQRLPATLLLTVEDNGIGFDTQSSRPGGGPPGLGLISIRERAALVGGAVRLESTPGKGMRLTVELPARPREQPPEAVHVLAGVRETSEVLGE
jgi:signal transduction histidine kinase